MATAANLSAVATRASTGLAVSAISSSSAASSDALLAPVPNSVPVLPDAFSPRISDQTQVIDVLLSRTLQTKSKSKVLAHGMGT